MLYNRRLNALATAQRALIGLGLLPEPISSKVTRAMEVFGDITGATLARAM